MSTTHVRDPETGLPVSSVLVALDGSPFSERAIPPACHLAARLGAPVHLWSAASVEEAEGRRAVIRTLAEAAGASWEVVVGDSPVRELSASDDAAGHRLVCLATHGHDHTAALLHSVSSATVAASDGPVLLVGPAVPAAAPPGRRLAVCVDGTGESELVLPLAFAWARVLGLEVTLLTVAEPVPESVLHPGSYPRLHGPHGDADAYVNGLVNAWSGEVPVTGKAIYDPVDVDRALVREFGVGRPDLVVMGTRSDHGLRRLILGSTAAAVAHRSPAPVLAVPLRPPKRT
jgi:nucleotide-binding universal stress UspA family protein